jgi:plastocyanin
MESARAWRISVAIAAVVTVVCSVFAVAAAVTSDDGNGPASRSAAQSPGSGSGEQVTIKNFSFDPPDLSVAAGTTVTWTNEDSTTHTVTGTDTDLIGSPDLNQGDTYSLTFDQAGTYHYICSIHTSMKGTVTVTG